MTGGPNRAFAGVGAVALALLVLPLAALLVAVPWDRAGALLASAAVADALRLSLVTSLAAAAAAMALGVPLAWVLARTQFPGKTLVRALAVLPMVLPPVVAGVALLLAFGRRGLLGAPLAALGITLPFSAAAVVLAQAYVALPFVVVTVETGFRLLDQGLEEAAAVLGADRWATWRRVTLPLVAPSLTAGLALGWARALGEFGATITFAGNLQGVTQTMPLAVFLRLETEPEAAYLLSAVLLAASVAILVALRGRFLEGR